MTPSIREDIGERNQLSAHVSEDRFKLVWSMIWEPTSLFANNIREAVTVEKPFSCTTCNKPLTYREMLHSGPALKDKAELQWIACYPCKLRDQRKWDKVFAPEELTPEQDAAAGAFASANYLTEADWRDHDRDKERFERATN
jgi:hypothetical protein